MDSIRSQLNFSKKEIRLLDIMSALLSEHICSSLRSNVPPGKIVITDQESKELGDLFGELLASKAFSESIYLVEELTVKDKYNEQRLKEIYARATGKRTSDSVQARLHWREFKARLGKKDDERSKTRQMSFDQFMKMEERLLNAADIPEDVTKLILKGIKKNSKKIKAILFDNQSIAHGTIRKTLTDSFIKKRPSRLQNLLTTNRLIGATSLIANVGAIYGTRDLGAAGTYSAIAGAVTMTIRG